MSTKLHCDVCDDVVSKGQAVFAVSLFRVSSGDETLCACLKCVQTRAMDVVALAQSKLGTDKTPRTLSEMIFGQKNDDEPEITQ